MTEPFKIAIAGLGTVGQGVVDIIQSNAALIKARTGRDIQIVAVSSANKNKARSVDVSVYEWVDSAADLAGRKDIDCVVELIGGEHGVAHDLVAHALESGQHVVTANKAMIARHGLKLAQKAEYKNVALKYEAAVAGGIPAIKTIKQGLAANNIKAVSGILNGTCNFILSEMGLSGRAFDDVLVEAQAKGYAEADPSFDIDGIDTGHKLCILSALAFGIKPDLDNVLEHTSGIREISSLDLKIADELGYKIKLLGSAHVDEQGHVAQSVEPCFVKKSAPLASVDSSFNAVFFDADFAGQVVNIGRGAGAGPTASAVVADIMDIVCGDIGTVFSVSASQLKDARYMDSSRDEAKYYIHLSVEDRPGVMANISSALSAEGLSIDELIQRHYHVDGPVSVVITTHKTTRYALTSVLNKLQALDCIAEIVSVYRIFNI